MIPIKTSRELDESTVHLAQGGNKDQSFAQSAH